MPVKKDRRRYMREYMRKYREREKSNLVQINPNYQVNEPHYSGTGATQQQIQQQYGYSRRIPTWDPAYVNKKMQEAYADASYKRGRRSPTRVSNQTIHNYFQEKEKAYADKVKAQVNKHKQEEKRSYVTGKATLRKGTNYAHGKIPAALRSYGSNWVTGAKSIGRSAKKLPAKVSKKLDNFYKKWLKW